MAVNDAFIILTTQITDEKRSSRLMNQFKGNMDIHCKCVHTYVKIF